MKTRVPVIKSRILGVGTDRTVYFEAPNGSGIFRSSNLKLKKNAAQKIQDVLAFIGKEVNITIEDDEITLIKSP